MKLRSPFLRLHNLFHSDERELHDELNFHPQLHIDDDLRQGLTRQEARHQALLKLGGLEQTKQQIGDQWSGRLPRRRPFCNPPQPAFASEELLFTTATEVHQ